MQIIREEFLSVKPTDSYRLYPIGDIHLGARNCDEDKLRQAIKQIEADPNGYWIGMGDYIEAINRFDKRFDPLAVASWVTVADLKDLGRAQTNYFLEMIKPIAHKCLCLLEGNHEEKQRQIHERDIYGDIVSGVKNLGEFPSEKKLRMDYYGYLVLSFYRTEKKKDGSRRVTLNLHHGTGGGGKPGGDANKMYDWLLSHDCDIALSGHTHKYVYAEAYVESVASGVPTVMRRIGFTTSSFLKSGTPDFVAYSERARYMPLGTTRSLVDMRPNSDAEDRIRVTSW